MKLIAGNATGTDEHNKRTLIERKQNKKSTLSVKANELMVKHYFRNVLRDFTGSLV